MAPDRRRRPRRPRRPYDDDEDGEAPQTEVTIEITGLSLYTHHGVSEAEREVGQRLVLDLRLEVGECDATRHRPGRGHRRLRRGLPASSRSSPSSARYKTLERLCTAIADRLLERLRRRRGVGQGGEARAADPAAGRGGLGRGLAPGRGVTDDDGERFASRDTAVAPLGDGSWPRSTGDWFTPRGANGGFLAAIVLRAMLAELDDPARAPRSLTLHYLRPPAAGACGSTSPSSARGALRSRSLGAHGAGRPPLRAGDRGVRRGLRRRRRRTRRRAARRPAPRTSRRSTTAARALSIVHASRRAPRRRPCSAARARP